MKNPKLMNKGMIREYKSVEKSLHIVAASRTKWKTMTAETGVKQGRRWQMGKGRDRQIHKKAPQKLWQRVL